MSPDSVVRLRELIAGGQVAFLVGAGVSMQVTGNLPAASWLGFIEAGVTRAAQLTARDPGTKEWLDEVRGEIESGDPDRRLHAEDMVLDRLGGPKSPHVAQWLADSVGALPIVDEAPIAALADLGVPLLTLNYDNLLEEVTGRPAVSWRQPVVMRKVIQGEQPGIIHLHGHWDDPQSVVLGTTGYANIASERAARKLVEAVSYSRTLVLVGFGAPLDAVQFAPLRAWLSDSPGGRHIRLVRRADRASFDSDELPAERAHLELVEYGESGDDLAPFLASLAAPEPDPPAGGEPAADDAVAANHHMSAGVRITWGLGAFGAVATAFQLLEKGGPATLACAVLIGAATMIVLHPKRSALSLAGSAATLVVALILAAFGLAGDGGDDDGRQASTSTGPDEVVVPPTVPTTATTATTPTTTATTPIRRPPPAPRGVRTKQLEWDGGPATKRALGALLIIGSIDFAVDDDDDEDVLRRLLVRVNAARCPKRTSWLDVRTGDRFEMAVGRHRYEIFVDHVEYANYAGPDLTTTVTRRPRAGGGPTLCTRS